MPLQSAYIEALLSTGRPEEAKAVVMDLANDAESRLFAWYVGIDVWLDPRFMEEGASPTIPFEAMEGAPDAWLAAAEFVNRYLRPGTALDLTDDEILELKAVYGPGLIEDRLFVNTVARSLLIAAGEIDHVLATDLSLFDTDELALHELQWVPAKAALRAHPDFGAYLEKANLLAYWDASGWPEFCQRIEGEVKCQ
jgi:hypothetical protein